MLKPNRGARLALSILAVPILLTAPLTGGITGALVVVAILMLWTGPARDWFAGRPVRELPVRGKPDKPANQGTWETTMPRDADRLHQPDQTQGEQARLRALTGERAADGPLTGTSRGQAHPTRVPAHHLGFLHPAPAPRPGSGRAPLRRPTALQRRRAPRLRRTTPGPMAPGQMATWSVDPSAVPVPVKIACALTWVFSGVVALMYAGCWSP